MTIAQCFESAFDFEKFIALKFEDIGFDVRINSKENEPGYDFLAIKGDRIVAVQVKNYKNKVSINQVLKFRDYMSRSNIKEGAIISSKGFSAPAISSIAAEKVKNFHMGHLEDNRITWDYLSKSIANKDQVRSSSHYISVFTAKGGVGKTVISAHLGGALAISGYKVSIVDGDPEENLYRLTGKRAIVPNSRTGKNTTVNVCKMSDWGSVKKNDESIIVFDCSPSLERNNIELLKKTESFIIPTSLSPLDIGNKAEVLLRTMEQIRECNKNAYIFILLNKYYSPSVMDKQRYVEVKKIISDLNDKCVLIDPEEDVSIRESKILRNWGSQPDLAFKTVAGRCYPRDDFLKLAEYLLEHLNIEQ